MGAESSVPRDGKSQEDAPASASASGGDLSAEGSVLQERSIVTDSKPLAKNGQISSMTSLNGHSEDNTLGEVGQPDGVVQKEEAPETMDTIQGEVVPQVNSEKVEKESPDANDISAVEEKAAEEKPGDANEVGFKKIFRFVGFKFTLKKDKSEDKDPVKLLTVKDKEEEVSGTDEPTKEQEEEKSTTEEKEADTDVSTAEAEVIKDDKAESSDTPAEGTAAEATDEAVKGGAAEKEGEITLSPFRKLFSTGLFSNLRKKASVKKTKEEEDKEAAVEEEATKAEETADAVEEKEEKDEAKQETNEEAPAAPEEEKTETSPEATDETNAAETTDDTKQEEEKAEAEVTSEAELLSSQEKVKSQGSPLKKLFTGAGLKKLSTKKQRAKREAEKKLTESGEQAGEQLQSSTESGEAPKTDSGPTSPEESVEVTQIESSQETDGEVVSDGEKKKDGIIAWSSFKKLVTPKKLVKRSSESDDEATGEKPAKSATLSSSESAPLADTSVEEEAQEDKPTEEEPKTENTEKLVSSTEEPKRKMDTSVSWEALMCMGGPKKRTRKTSDSDDEETKVEEEPAAEAAVEGEEQEVEAEAAIVTSQNSESDAEVASSPEPSCPAPERETTWDTLKRMVMPKNKAKVEEKPEEATEQVLSDSEAPKDESSFSLRKLFPGRRKKKAEKQASTEQGEEDSDTPAVVPLSEYEDQVEAEQEAQEEEAPAEPTEVQIKVTAEDRSPSWIAAAVEEGDDKHDQLSDIPEEAENAATPKSVDTDIAEDEDKESSPKPPRRTGRRLSTAEVMPFAPAPTAETTPVPQGPNAESAVAVLEGIKSQVTKIPPQVDVTVEDVPTEEASEKTEYEPPTEKVETSTCTILQLHACDEAMAICTGLGTKEIAKVAMEKPAMPIAECVAVIHDSVSTELAVMQKPPSAEEAIDSEDAVLIAQVHQVEATELEPMVESPQSDSSVLKAASVSLEPGLDQVGIVSVQESEIIMPASLTENSLKVFVADPITLTSETAVCTQSVAVTEPTVETKEIKLDVEQLAATEDNTGKEVVQSVTEEIAATIYEGVETSITEETEPATHLIVPSEEVVIAQTLVLVAPANEDASEIEDAPETVVEKVEEIIEQTSEIEAQSMVIAHNVIQDAVDKVSEDKPESEDSDTPAPDKAIATTEEEIEISTESPVITETPVAVECKAPKSPKLLHVAMEVIDTTIVEVTGSLDASVEENKPEEELKKDVEVKVGEETIVLEEVVEIKSESQTEEELEEVKEEQSKEEAEVKEVEVEEKAEEVEPQSEEEKSDSPSEENKENVLEIHMPVQVVLQTAQVFEEPSVEEEAAVEFDSNGPVAEDTSVKPKKAAKENQLSTLSEEPQVPAAAEVSTPSQDSEAEAPGAPSGKCAEVMAQVMEVIEEAVKEIEPVSTEITAAS
ncbi:A-kinase anchor protein 12b isoform X1 [Gymnodraco acuticeps]|uniref:A-kinase anchor protein 12b isoform X1 n=1 Tax=Gymnodraco acuticeps TaxID=8218 RepID=A0A6P8T509_GYMAC|nr:A-kinase anchor protein 12b isoform X1 [Gymnodraco acuticeps]